MLTEDRSSVAIVASVRTERAACLEPLAVLFVIRFVFSAIFRREQHAKRSVVHLRRHAWRRDRNDVAQADDTFAVHRHKMRVASR